MKTKEPGWLLYLISPLLALIIMIAFTRSLFPSFLVFAIATILTVFTYYWRYTRSQLPYDIDKEQFQLKQAQTKDTNLYPVQQGYHQGYTGVPVQNYVPAYLAPKNPTSNIPAAAERVEFERPRSIYPRAPQD